MLAIADRESLVMDAKLPLPPLQAVGKQDVLSWTHPEELVTPAGHRRAPSSPNR